MMIVGQALARSDSATFQNQKMAEQILENVFDSSKALEKRVSSLSHFHSKIGKGLNEGGLFPRPEFVRSITNHLIASPILPEELEENDFEMVERFQIETFRTVGSLCLWFYMNAKEEDLEKKQDSQGFDSEDALNACNFSAATIAHSSFSKDPGKVGDYARMTLFNIGMYRFREDASFQDTIEKSFNFEFQEDSKPSHSSWQIPLEN